MTEPEPVKQVGEIVKFTRLKPEQSQLKSDISLDDFYNQVRMLDAESYPNAYIQFGRFRLEFTSASKVGSELKAVVNIIEENKYE